jgi:hypothetical protein
VLFVLYAILMFALLNTFVINFLSFLTYVKVDQFVSSLFVSSMLSVVFLLCGCVIIVSLYPFHMQFDYVAFFVFVVMREGISI